MSRVHFDLIDMSSKPCSSSGDKWIMHARDHCSNFSYATSLSTKEMANVSKAIHLFLCLFGKCEIAVHDCGTEFVGEMTKDVFRSPTVEQRITI